MRYRAIIALLAVVLLAPPVSAGIIDVTCYNDSDGAITWGSGGWGYNPSLQNLWMWEVLHWWPAHVYADITVDGDPTITFTKNVLNDTNFDWTDYHITIIRRLTTFTIDSAVQPAGWDPPVITQPVLMNSYIIDGLDVGPAYVGSVDYFMGSGSPVLIGGSGQFKATVTFFGNSNFILEQIPTPEPAGLMLLLAGGALLFRRQRD